MSITQKLLSVNISKQNRKRKEEIKLCVKSELEKIEFENA